MKRPAKKHTYDDTLLVTVLILVLVGLILLTSTSAYNGRVKFHDSYYYLKRQGLATVLGMAGMLWIARIDYHRWIPLAVPGYLAAIGLSIAVMAFGKEYNGSKRWLSLGPFSFQPSEFAKVAVILFLAWLINRNVKKISKLRIMSGMMLSILPVVGLVGASNLSTAIIILGIAVTLIFVASPRYAQFIWMAVSGVGFLGIFLALESYRLERLAIWRNPEKYEKGYQTLQGLYAIGSGGLFGRGLGNSVQKLGFLPEAQNDMIFSIVCEELGLVGAGGYHCTVSDFNLEIFCDCNTRTGSFWCVDCSRSHGTYDDSGNIEYCCRHKFYTEYRNYTSVYQLWWNVSCFSAFGNGACP